MCTIVPADEQEVKAKTSGGASDGRCGVPRRAGSQQPKEFGKVCN